MNADKNQPQEGTKGTRTKSGKFVFTPFALFCGSNVLVLIGVDLCSSVVSSFYRL
jgi:hypothetical protein